MNLIVQVRHNRFLHFTRDPIKEGISGGMDCLLAVFCLRTSFNRISIHETNREIQQRKMLCQKSYTQEYIQEFYFHIIQIFISCYGIIIAGSSPGLLFLYSFRSLDLMKQLKKVYRNLSI